MGYSFTKVQRTRIGILLYQGSAYFFDGSEPSRQKFDGGIVFLDEEGFVMYTEPNLPDLIRQDWSDRDFFMGSKLGKGSLSAIGRIRDDVPLYPVVLPIAVSMAIQHQLV